MSVTTGSHDDKLVRVEWVRTRLTSEAGTGERETRNKTETERRGSLIPFFYSSFFSDARYSSHSVGRRYFFFELHSLQAGTTLDCTTCRRG